MKAQVYLDTSVISAFFDNRTPERKALTQAAWKRFDAYDIVLSDLVVEELESAPSPLREGMLAAVAGFTVLSVSDPAKELAEQYIEQGIFPRKYSDDALHVAIASINQAFVLPFKPKEKHIYH